MQNYPVIVIEKNVNAPAGMVVHVDGMKFTPGLPQAHNRARVMLPDYVIKIERTILDNCLDQTAQEALIWRREKNGPWARYLVPILKYKLAPRPFAYRDKFQYSLQPKVKFRPGRPSNAALSKAGELFRYLEKKYDLTDLEVDEVGFNWSIGMDGQPLVFDYGY